MNNLLEIASYAVALPCIPAIFRFKYFTKDLKFISLYVVLCAVVEFISSLLWSYKINNLSLLHIYVPATFLLLFLFYREVLQNLLSRIAWYTIAAVFFMFSIIDSLWLQGIAAFNSYTLNLESGIIIFFSILCFYKISREMKVVLLEKYPVFWINTGILLYFSGSLLVFTLSNESISFSRTIRMYLWSAHALFVTLMYIMISIGLWVYRRK